MKKQIYWLIGIIILSILIIGCKGSKSTDNLTEIENSGIVVNPKTDFTEEEKISLLRNDIRPIQYNPIQKSVKLYAATTSGKPCTLPDDQSDECNSEEDDPNAVFQPVKPVYSNGFDTAFVEKGKDEHLWFAYAPNVSGIERIVWQVSEKPFTLNKETWETPTGLLSSGEVTINKGEFEIDFSQIAALSKKNKTKNPVYSLDTDPRYFPTQRKFYIRILALDESGDPIGTPDKGLEITYGYPYSAKPTNIHFLFPLKSGEVPGEPHEGEFPNELQDFPEHTYYSDDYVAWFFRPEGFPKNTETIYLQISKTVLKNGIDDWRTPPNMIHEIKLTKGSTEFDELSNPNHAIPIDFNSFADFPSACYVRAVALSPGKEPGTVLASYSKSVKMLLKEDRESIIEETAFPEEISPEIPEVKLLEYTPIRTEAYQWEYYYKVIHQPTWSDISAVFNNTPNANELVPELPVGTVIKFEEPKPEKKTWYEEAWESIKSFFNDIKSFLADIVNWVSKTYTDVKMGLINYVAENFPLIPDSLRDELKKALETMVDYGLASIGIPPELPNFDELTSMGTEYLAATALDAAGIPEAIVDPSDVINMTETLGEEVDKQMSYSANSAGPNPLHWNFVRLNPNTLYRPAFMLLQIRNPYNHPTPTGFLYGNVTTILTNIQGNANREFLYTHYCNMTHFKLFKPVNMSIPSLQPGQSITVPVIFQEYTGEAYQGCSTALEQNDFFKLYTLDTASQFEFTMGFNLPPIDEYINKHDLPVNNGGYMYKDTQRIIKFENIATQKLAM